MQMVTSASDGLVKLWNIKDEECVKTLDNHEDKVSPGSCNFMDVQRLMRILDLGISGIE